ncbi:uncharacterized protein YcfL [Acetoanaerobium pronyense]|uniref:Uncharacterized protein YcfL n=1 Tax=Acetoanaerobium pronyense TaxID=1482736 RepID=A0ABS4KPD6_9FIRM|nr:hypothetical protein [Acetoanaerobium pronyense]MBP2028474.1 uncharacterized protein YcfL [Acetoanaerobium pronyense]
MKKYSLFILILLSLSFVGCSSKEIIYHDNGEIKYEGEFRNGSSIN